MTDELRLEKYTGMLSAIFHSFPEAEIVKRDGSREKLSVFFGLAVDVKSGQAISRQSKRSVMKQQPAFDFGDNFNGKKRGGT